MRKLSKFIAAIALSALILAASSITIFAAAYKSEPDVIPCFKISGYDFDIGISDVYTTFNEDSFTYHIYDQSGKIIVDNLQGDVLWYVSSFPSEHEGPGLYVSYWGYQDPADQMIDFKLLNKYTLVIEAGAFSTADNQASPEISISFKPIDLNVESGIEFLKVLPQSIYDTISYMIHTIITYIILVPTFIAYLLIMIG